MEIKGDLSVGRNISIGGKASIGGTPNTNAILDLISTDKAFIPPRMTTAQKLAIPSPTEGMQVFDTDLKLPSFYNNTEWVETTGGGGGSSTEVIQKYRFTCTASLSYTISFDLDINNFELYINGLIVYSNFYSVNAKVLSFNAGVITIGDECLIIDHVAVILPISPQYQSIDGLTTQQTYALSFTPPVKASILVFLNGAIVHPDDYEITSNQITFDADIISDDDKITIYLITSCIEQGLNITKAQATAIALIFG